MISNTVVDFNKNRKFPLMIVNNTNKTVKLRRGCVVGKASHLEEINVVNVNQSQGTSGLEKLDESEISVPQEFKKDILRMIRDNEDIFATSNKDLGCTDTVQMTIDTGDHLLIKLKPYRAPLKQRKIIDKAIEELLEANIIRKSRSAWAAPIIIVSKKDKTSRMCVDFRSLNAASKIYSFPLPLIDDLLASVGKAKVMTSLDLKSGYYQVKVKESDKEKTAFVCHKGLFEFNVLPIGLASWPSLFSELVTELDGTATKAHAEQIRLAKLDWEIPNNNQGNALRKAAYVVPVESQSEDSSDDESIDSDTPLNQIARYKKERENSDEDDIQLMELSKKNKGEENFLRTR
ncbi:Transposon Ty3-I Gag-Pol polyprotein,Transposon Ty3-G Gag-Pol polyprotein [Mytilus coruscus]|uniref:Transposon Ty3-I Gag-Pol polyprotein,Transposon Ty3-G Gag-Pol polyprotein n=1 Tax=Mytilus coruscus TaxID=42192 RepID=A0A6J8DRH6_MYTCO|nr:Transposon Ty3-I Gag-Pol polyprotein,Transposon Ty3-G Gag-Pol polyprotein [Mytilus coruscus]